jgi:hypothetical protein
MVRKRVTPVTGANGTLEVKLLTQRKHAMWPGATSVKIENIIKKKLETVSLSHSTPVNAEEREPALLAAAFRELAFPGSRAASPYTLTSKSSISPLTPSLPPLFWGYLVMVGVCGGV